MAEVSHGDAVPAEPRPARAAASSDEEAAEEPKSRRVRASPSGKGVKVPLFPGLNTSALKVRAQQDPKDVSQPGEGTRFLS